MGDGLLTMIATAGRMEQFILLLLAIASVALWSVVFLKIPELREAKRNSRKFLENFDGLSDSPATGDCVHLRIHRAALAAMRKRPGKATDELILVSMQEAASNYFLHLQKGFAFMATVGSTTPFIGLFGTVVGIMTTFHDLGQTKTPNMQVVAPGISGALVATAAGLAVAIPAVIACNTFNAQIEEIRESANGFIEKMMAMIRAEKTTTVAAASPRPTTAAAPAARTSPKPAPSRTVADEDDDDEDDDDDDEPELVTRKTGRAGA